MASLSAAFAAAPWAGIQAAARPTPPSPASPSAAAAAAARSAQSEVKMENVGRRANEEVQEAACELASLSLPNTADDVSPRKRSQRFTADVSMCRRLP
uniref:Uncharacterized protein n=1 Tax=Sphaerodactylus townsendi TaxID=933632 RepID=A0ACB8GAR1_9SAUR